MFIVKAENKVNKKLVKYLAYQPGMGWYLTDSIRQAFQFSQAERRLWRSQQSKSALGWLLLDWTFSPTNVGRSSAQTRVVSR
jgi:hypothetical protein